MGRGKEGKETEKNNSCTLSFKTNGYLGDLLDGWPEKVHLEETFSKMRLKDAAKTTRALIPTDLKRRLLMPPCKAISDLRSRLPVRKKCNGKLDCSKYGTFT